MQGGKVCLKCGKPKANSAYFKSNSEFHSDGLIPICRKCIVNVAYNPENDSINLEGFKDVLRQVDKPFLPDLLNSAENQYEDGASGKLKTKINPKEGINRIDTIIGLYFKNINSLPQYNKMTWKDGVTDDEMIQRNSKRRSDDPVYFLKGNDFEVTESMIRLFGEGYTSKEYETMQRIYDDMIQDYSSITKNQKNVLLRYIRFSAKEEIATANSEISEAEKWAKMASDAFKQLNSVDNQGNISSFSEFFQKFEREKDVTRILPKFKYRPNDAPDFIIWCYINYCRRLEGKPEVPYEDVYKFYDDKVAEYVKQYGDPYGIFTDDPTLKNREKIKDFINLPDDYYGDEHGG